MCLTLPAKVLSIDDFIAKVEINGKGQMVKVGTSDKIEKGDWVLYTGDYLIRKIDESEANEINSLLGSYKNIDLESLDGEVKEILLASKSRDLTVTEIERLLSLDEESAQALYAEANIVRKSSIKDHICIHGIIEFSNYCKNDCLYCGIRKSNDKLNRYRMEPDEIIETAVRAVNEKGYKILVLQSGEDDCYDTAKLERILKGIKEKARVFIYLSVGDRSTEELKRLKEAGASGMLYRFETSNPQLYSQLHGGEGLQNRIENIKMMKSLGYVISTGMIIGLPGQTLADLANDILMMKELDAFMPSMGPLIPSSGTPLEKEETTDLELVKKVISVTRLLMPKSRIPVTTAMETIGGPDARHECFMAGANSVMFNLTPEKYRKDYSIYQNKFFDKEKKYEKWALFKGELSYKMMEEELEIKI